VGIKRWVYFNIFEHRDVKLQDVYDVYLNFKCCMFEYIGHVNYLIGDNVISLEFMLNVCLC